MLNNDGTEKRKPISFKIEKSIYDEFKEFLKTDNNPDNIGLTPGGWLRKQIILYNNSQCKKEDI